MSSFSCKSINRYFYHCRRVLPEALDSVSSASIIRHFHRCERLIEAYGAVEVYRTKGFAERVYKSHRRVVDGKGEGFILELANSVLP